MNEYSGIDWENKWSYPLQWIYESEVARRKYQCEIFRVQLAMQGEPFENLYEKELTSVINNLDDEKEKEQITKKCLPIPTVKSFALSKAVRNRANQMASGVDQYEYIVNDPYMIINDETEDLLAAKCEQDYIENRLDTLATVVSTDLTKYGLFAAIVDYNPCNDKNSVKRIHPKNVWFDTKYSTTGEERFRGYNKMISWAKLKKMLVDDTNEEINLDIKAPDRSILKNVDNKWEVDEHVKYSNKKIRSLNGLDIYVQDMNKLAESASLQGWTSTFPEYAHDLGTCYNLGWYHTFATDPKARTKSGYNGDDVELTIIYDLDRKIEFKIINRRFVISANSKAFCRKIDFKIEDPITGEIRHRLDDFHLDCPLKFQREEQDNQDLKPYPTSHLFNVLPLHDRLCSWRAKREHVAKLLATLRIETNGADASSFKNLLNIMGIVLDDIQGDVNSLNFAYDWTAIDTEIAYLENEIKTVLAGYDQFDAMQMMGDRASAAESGMAVSAVAQGLSTHQNAIMRVYADIARQMIANRVAYSPNREFAVSNRGNYGSLTIQEMALTATINVKSKLSKTVHEKIIASNSMQLMAQLMNQGRLNDSGIAFLIEQAMFGAAPRKLAASFLKQPKEDQAAIQAAQLNGQNMANQLAQNQQMYNQNPTQYEMEDIQENASPEEMDEIISQMGGAIEPDDEEVPGVKDVDMESQDGAYVSNMDGVSPELGAMTANPNSMI
jgi:hypothetical protein